MSSETRTFRLDNEIIKYLEQEAKKQGATLNGLVCRILRNYVRIESKIKQIGIISLFKDDFINILNLSYFCHSALLQGIYFNTVFLIYFFNKSITVISGGANILTGGPHVPVPLLI